MRILLYLLLAPLFVFAQGEQLYADGSASDQDGNSFEWINYGTQDWAIENAEVVTYRDGTEIPQVTDDGIWANLTTGAWCYHNNDPTRGKLYNWFAVAGIHDNDPNSPNKEFAPDGWHVPSDTEWTTLVNYLIANGYNYDGTTTQNQIAKSVASTSGWDSYPVVSAVGNNQSLNNTSGFNGTPSGNRYIYGNFQNYGKKAFFYSSSEGDNSSISRIHHMTNESSSFESGNSYKKNGFSVRFVRDTVDTEPPVITINGATTVSVNQGATYTDEGATASDNVDGNLTNQIVTVNNVNTAVAGTYTVTYSVTDSAGNSSTVTRTVNVIENPTVYAGTDLAICENETVTLGEASASNYSSLQWESSGDGTFTPNPFVLNATYTPGLNDITNGFVILTLRANGTNGQLASASVRINITSLPTVNAGIDFAVNEGETIQLSEATAYNYSSLYWTTSGNGSFNDSQSLNPIYTPSQLDTINGYVDLTMTATSYAPCSEVVTDTVTITINPNPTVNAGPDLSVCQAEAVTITGASASNISSLVWTTNGSGTITDAFSLTPTYTPGAADIASGAVTLTLTANGTNGQQASDSVVINIEQAHLMVVSSGSQFQTICEGDAISDTDFTVSNGATSAVLVGAPPGIALTPISAGVFRLSGVPTASISTPTTFVFDVLSSGNQCSIVTRSVSISVHPDDEMFLTSGSLFQTVCEGEPIEDITYALAGGSTNAVVSGLPSGVSYIVNNGIITISGTPTDDISTSTAYTYTLTSIGSCAPTYLQGVITIEPNHEIQLTSNNGNQTVDQGASINPVTYSIRGGATGAQIAWDVAPSGLVFNYDIVAGTVTISGAVTGNITTQTVYTYIVTTTGNSCDQSSYSGTITVNPVEINPTETGILLNGTVSAENNQIKNVADPSAEQDAINKRYLDQRLTTNEELVNKQYVDQIIAQLQSLIDGLQEEINILKTDTQAPVITLLGNNPVAVNQGATYTDEGATASDNVDGDISAYITATSTVDTSAAGTYTVTYTVSDAAGNAATPVVRTVNVLDTQVPVITITGATTVSVNQGATYTDAGATAQDNVDGNITANITATSTVDTTTAGTYTVTYTVSDAAGNTATPKVRTVNVLDTEAPVITLLGANPLEINQGITYNEPGATAQDNVDGNITANIVISGTVNTAVLGAYTITYNVSDAAGNMATQVTRTVTVMDPQRYADGTATDQDGNSFEWINYGTQDWAIENAEVVTYRDGSEIPQVTDDGIWANLTTGAWCYINNDPTKRKLYNWYAVMGIHDTDPNTPNKEFAPEGWHVPTDTEWTILKEYLIAKGYNYDDTTTGNKIAKAMASTTGWSSSTEPGGVGNDQSLNNSSGFNAFPSGGRSNSGSFSIEGFNEIFWSSTENNANNAAWYRFLNLDYSNLSREYVNKRNGLSVRFVKD